MEKAILDQLRKLCDEGADPKFETTAEYWSTQVAAFLTSAIGPGAAEEFLGFRDASDVWNQHSLRLGYLQGLAAKAAASGPEVPPSKASPVASPLAGSPTAMADSRRVFVVHGHDNEAKEGAARFLEKLGLRPIILHEQPSAGRTVVEKLEQYSGDTTFAVVLLTPDDIGAVGTAPHDLKPRARQNVIMELGYFIGKLGRTRVCALHKGGVELPSDYQGILYIEMDDAGAWKSKLAQECVQAKLPIELSGLLGG